MKRNLFIVAFLVLVVSVVSQPLLTSPAIATSDNPRYDLQDGVDNCFDSEAVLPCFVSTGDDEFAIYLAPCTAAITNFCFTATVDDQPAPSTLQFVARVSAYKTQSGGEGAGYESGFVAYYVPPGSSINSKELTGECCWVPPNQTSGGGRVDLTDANVAGKVVKIVMKYKVSSLPQYSMVVSDDGNMDFDLDGQNLTVTAEGKAARVAVDSAEQHIDFDTEKSEDESLPWANRCGIPSMQRLVCNVETADSDGLMFYGKSKALAFPDASQIAQGPIWVSHSATYFLFPSYDPNTKQISTKTAAPHFLADGITLNKANFNAFLPNGILSQWGIEKTQANLQAALAATVEKEGGGEVVQAPNFEITSDGVKVKFEPITFSAPVISVKNKTVKAAAKSKAWPKVDKVVKVKVGTTLNAIKGTWTGIPTPQITYQWYVCSQKVARATQSIPSNCKSVRLQTRTKFRLTSAHKGKYITVRVIGKSGGTSNTVWLAISTDKVI